MESPAMGSPAMGSPAMPLPVRTPMAWQDGDWVPRFQVKEQPPGGQESPGALYRNETAGLRADD